MLAFCDVTFAYPGKPALFENVSFTFAAGGFFVIRGPSGTGKTSLLRLMNRLEEPRKGDIRFKGKPLSSYPPQSVRTSIVYIQQTPIAMNGSVRENLLLPFRFKSNSRSDAPDDSYLAGVMDDYRLDDISLDTLAQQLSVGQLQRVCLIRGLLLSPEIILLDEPTSALDEESSRAVESSVERLCRDSRRTVIMVSHKHVISETITPVLLELSGGQIREVP